MTRLRPPAPPIEYRDVIWSAGTPLYRGHERVRLGNEFNPGFGSPTRFAFFQPYRRPHANPVPILYAGETNDVAIGEYLFHNLPYGVGAVLPFADLIGRGSTRIIPRVNLRLARLHDAGLRVLDVRNSDLIDSMPSTYSRTVLWARALHATDSGLHGLQWMSRQFNSRRAVALFGDRVSSADLIIDPAWDSVPFDHGPGLTEVLRASADAGIVLTLPPP